MTQPRRHTTPPLIVMPAIIALAIGAIVLLIVLLAGPDRATLVERYAREADRAITAGEVATAQLCAQRLIQLEPDEPLHRQRLATANAIGR